MLVGDELGGGQFSEVPGGKHVYDIDWDEGSPEDPLPIGFTHAPNSIEEFQWTIHYHDAIPQSLTKTGSTLLVDGGYHEGLRTCDITDPLDPTPAEQHPTLADKYESNFDGHVPFAWSVEYNAKRDFVFVSDSHTGAYTFRVSNEGFDFRSIEAEITRSFPPEDEIGECGVMPACHYCEDHATVSNTGGQSMTPDQLAEIKDADQ